MLCPKCLSLERHRLLWLYLKNRTEFFTAKLKVLHVAPEQCFFKTFRNMKNLVYLTADLESPLADMKLDIQDMPFPENEFDVIICNHVLEHVPDDRKAMHEIFRVLKKGGFAILQVPTSYGAWNIPMRILLSQILQSVKNISGKRTITGCMERTICNDLLKPVFGTGRELPVSIVIAGKGAIPVARK